MFRHLVNSAFHGHNAYISKHLIDLKKKIYTHITLPSTLLNNTLRDV